MLDPLDEIKSDLPSIFIKTCLAGLGAFRLAYKESKNLFIAIPLASLASYVTFEYTKYIALKKTSEETLKALKNQHTFFKSSSGNIMAEDDMIEMQLRIKQFADEKRVAIKRT